MLRYIEYTLADNGFYVAALGGVGEIWGLDNRLVDEDGFEDDQRFWHLGKTPDLSTATVCYETPDQAKALAIYPDGAQTPEGGTEIAAADVPTLLMSAAYGWPVGTTLDAAGMPQRPEREL